jgi:phosphohistidine phosphatase
MNIYLTQHGRPVPKEEDPDRPLSEQGKQDVEKIAIFLRKAGIEIDEVFHSGKTRARQSAEILISKINPGNSPLEKSGLSPIDDINVIAKEIKNHKKNLMIVGHLPHLAKLVSLLTSGSESNAVVSFQQGGVVCLRQTDDGKKGWTIAWMLVPEIISP